MQEISSEEIIQRIRLENPWWVGSHTSTLGGRAIPGTSAPGFADPNDRECRAGFECRKSTPTGNKGWGRQESCEIVHPGGLGGHTCAALGGAILPKRVRTRSEERR